MSAPGEPASASLRMVAPSMTQTPTAKPAIEHPTYATMAVEQMVERPAAEVWSRIGKFCDIGEWMQVDCKLIAGTDGQLGAVRFVAGGFVEMLVGRTDLSYTYAQPVRLGVPYNAYHATLEVKPVTEASSKIIYSFFYDNSTMADDAARAAERTDRRERFEAVLLTMKQLAEEQLGPSAAR